MEIPDEMLKEIRESGYDQELVYNYIRELLNSDKEIAEALADYPIINGKAFLMISSYGSTGLRINEIGKKHYISYIFFPTTYNP